MTLYVKMILLSTVMVFSVQAEIIDKKFIDKKFTDQVLFEKSFVATSEVESVINAFFTNFFIEELSTLEIRFFEETDVSYGFVGADFSAQLPSENSHSDIEGQFAIYTNPFDGSDSEYGLHFETEFTITPTASFLYFIREDLSLCKEDISFNICQIFHVEDLDSNTKLANITDNLYAWKDNMITQLNKATGPEHKDFAQSVLEQVVIEEGSDSIILNMNLAKLQAEFKDQVTGFFKIKKLRGFSIESIRLEFFEDQISVSLHIQQLFLAKDMLDYLELSSFLQDLFENEERLIGLSQAIRESVSQRSFSKVTFALKNLEFTEMTNITKTKVQQKFWGTEVPVIEDKDLPIDTELEEELGLD